MLASAILMSLSLAGILMPLSLAGRPRRKYGIRITSDFDAENTT